ncbi:DUF1542 domain-containing protein [Staphylococcus saccharolyticus]|nr:DUF1542 domain-containing protein [Staphylococcus saccharolyticus]
MTAQLQQINSNNIATTEEKEVAINNVNTHKQDALDDINSASSTQDVRTTQQNGINTINQDQPNAVKKKVTRMQLSQKAQEKKDQIG